MFRLSNINYGMKYINNIMYGIYSISFSSITIECVKYIKYIYR